MEGGIWGNDRRKYYGHVETNVWSVTNPVYTIKEWLERQTEYSYSYNNTITYCLARYKEHIYTRSEDGYPKMTFVGYGKPACTDFLFYNPESDGEKVVNFNVDSSQVFTHTLEGSGFLVNTGVDEQNKLYGYMVYYFYTNVPVSETPVVYKAQATNLMIYKLDGIDINALHNTQSESVRRQLLGTPIKSMSIPEWDDHMSIQIKATPNKIEIRHQPVSATTDINTSDFVLECPLSVGSIYSGFGPVVAYSSHNCSMASSFTYSNLRMYFTNPELEPGDMLNPLEKADFTQQNTQKYFINLFGNSSSNYNESANFGQYQEYMEMMQKEGIALITDKTTPFGDYLGESNAPDSNLCEISRGDSLPSIEDLVAQITSYIGTKATTSMQGKIQTEEGGAGLKKAEPKQSVGNIWIKSASSGRQFGTLNGDSLPDAGFTIQPVDNIAEYYEKTPGEAITVTYDLIKPNGSIMNLGTVGKGETPPFFTVTKDSKEWQAGRYTVRQTISNSSVHGYAYFELKRTTVTSDTDYTVTIHVNKDGSAWNDSGKTFILQSDNVEPIRVISDFNHVPNGTYNLYDTTGAANADDYKNTGVMVTVNGADTSTTLDYYTVTFCDENDETFVYGTPQIVQRNEIISAPTESPTKNGCTFHRWNTSTDGREAFDFINTQIQTKTNIYAGWMYPVTVNVHKDGEQWDTDEGKGKTFALATEDEENITFLGDTSNVQVLRGNYSVYETTGLTDINAYEDTGVDIAVTGMGAAATINYYTVTCYNDDTVWGTPQIVRSGKTAVAPAENPTKDGHTFYRWSPSKTDNSTDFNFGLPVTGTTNVYASWKENPQFTITASAGTGGSVSPSGEVKVEIHHNQQFVITPDKGYKVASILVDGNAQQINAIPITYSSLSESRDTISGSAAVTENTSKLTGEENIKYQLFEDVTEDHTLAVTFEKIKTKSRKSGSTPEPVQYDTPAPPAAPMIKTETPDIPAVPVPVPVPEQKDDEPKTGDDSHVEIYATIGMIAGLSYLLLYFADGTSGMTEEEKKEIVGALVKWARKGKRFRKYVALAIVFVILVYYHSIGKRTTVEWKELYEK